VSRRGFLGACLLALGALAGGAWFRTSAEQYVEEVIRRVFPDATYDGNCLGAFASDYCRLNAWLARPRPAVFREFVRIPGTRSVLPRSLARRAYTIESGIVGDFVLFTDLDDSAVRGRRPISYLGMGNRWAMTCTNPFAEMV
jgi:hypothetical protein